MKIEQTLTSMSCNFCGKKAMSIPRPFNIQHNKRPIDFRSSSRPSPNPFLTVVRNLALPRSVWCFEKRTLFSLLFMTFGLGEKKNLVLCHMLENPENNDFFYQTHRHHFRTLLQAIGGHQLVPVQHQMPHYHLSKYLDVQRPHDANAPQRPTDPERKFN